MITLQHTSRQEVTLLSNSFIDHHMPKANGEFVKVYIYLLRMLDAASGSFSLEQMADRLLCTEGDILRALKYWENEKLLVLQYDKSGTLSGITLCDEQHMPEPAASAPRKANVPTVPGKTSIKMTLTPDRVKELKQNEEIVQLLYIAEQYLGKALAPSEIQKLLFFYDGLDMSIDLIDYLIEYCVGRGHKSIRYIETVAMAWATDGITTVAMAKDSTSRYGKNYFTVLKFMGITNRNPVDTEISMIDTWTKDYGFTMDIIQEACSRTVLQTGQPSFQYADKILSDWLKKGVRSKDDISRLDAQHQKRKKAQPAASSSVSSNRFNNFHQRDYNFDEYEKKLLNK